MIYLPHIFVYGTLNHCWVDMSSPPTALILLLSSRSHNYESKASFLYFIQVMISLAFLLRFLVNIESGRFSHRRLFSEESLGAEREAAQNRTGCGVCAERGRARAPRGNRKCWILPERNTEELVREPGLPGSSSRETGVVTPRSPMGSKSPRGRHSVRARVLKDGEERHSWKRREET